MKGDFICNRSDCCSSRSQPKRAQWQAAVPQGSMWRSCLCRRFCLDPSPRNPRCHLAPVGWCWGWGSPWDMMAQARHVGPERAWTPRSQWRLRWGGPGSHDGSEPPFLQEEVSGCLRWVEVLTEGFQICKWNLYGFLVTGLRNYYLALISGVRFVANANSPELLKKEKLKSFVFYGNSDNTDKNWFHAFFFSSNVVSFNK